MRDNIAEIENKEYLIGIKISLDGPSPESHGFIRRDTKGNYNFSLFNITLRNIFFFKEEGIPFTIATVLHKENIKKFNEFQKLIKKINPISWFISPIIPVGRGEANKFISEFYEYFDNWRKLSYERNVLNVFDKMNAPQTWFISEKQIRSWFDPKEFSEIHITPYKGVSWRGSGVKI